MTKLPPEKRAERDRKRAAQTLERNSVERARAILRYRQGQAQSDEDYQAWAEEVVTHVLTPAAQSIELMESGRH